MYDIDFLENCTHDRTYITLYVHEFLLRLYQHCFLDKKAPRTTLIYDSDLIISMHLYTLGLCNYSFGEVTSVPCGNPKFFMGVKDKCW